MFSAFTALPHSLDFKGQLLEQHIAIGRDQWHLLKAYDIILETHDALVGTKVASSARTAATANAIDDSIQCQAVAIDHSALVGALIKISQHLDELRHARCEASQARHLTSSQDKASNCFGQLDKHPSVCIIGLQTLTALFARQQRMILREERYGHRIEANN